MNLFTNCQLIHKPIILYLVLHCIMVSCDSEQSEVETKKYFSLIKSFSLNGIPNQGVIDNLQNTITIFAPFEDGVEYQSNFTVSVGAVSEPHTGAMFGIGTYTIAITSQTGEERIYKLALEHRDRMALLIIDLQNANFPVYNQTELLENINSLHDRASNTNAVTIFVQHTDTGPWAQGTETWEIHRQVKPNYYDVILQKKTISAMTLEMIDTLNALKIDKLVVTGTLTNLCIAETIKPAYQSGYRIFVPEGGHSTNADNPEKIISYFYNTYRNYITVCSVDEVKF